LKRINNKPNKKIIKLKNKVMKQKNKIQLLLVAAFTGVGVMCYAQGKMCKDVPGGYDIVSLQDPSDPSSYQWMEDGKNIGGATAAVYTVPADKAVGSYTYIRRSKKEGCDWASSNAYTVEVLICDEDPKSIGDKGVVKDARDGKVYKIVKMPDGKVWMAENLNYQSGLTFNQQAGQANGVPYTSPDNGVPAIGSFWCPPISGATLSADKNTCNVYGALYTWETAMSENGQGVWNESAVSGRYHDVSTTPAAAQSDPKVQGICPAGYHLPNEYEWAALLVGVDPAGTYTAQVSLGFYGSNGPAGAQNEGAGVKMKSASNYTGTDTGVGAWFDNANRGNNVTGFGAVPAGSRTASGANLSDRGILASFWTSTPANNVSAYRINFTNGRTNVERYNNARSGAYSVRCVKD
jgi:uncharacterized protein (TIGR02145 family)